MQIIRTQSTIEILAPAKVNLFLEVLGKRGDGFHEVDTVLCPIAIFDHLTVTPKSTPGLDFELILPESAGLPETAELSQSGDPAWTIPADESNLVVRAYQRVQSELGFSTGCHLRLEKRVPAAAGLGGGSSDTAAAVVAFLLAFGGWNRELATRLCASLGSDIPFFLGDESRIGLAHATGRGERCELLSAAPPLEFVVTHPPVGCATKEIYAGYKKIGERRTSREIIASCEDGQAQKIGAELFNALQFSASGLTEWIDSQIGLFSRCGIQYALMSGSGSSCFALVDDSASKVEMLQRIRSEAAGIGLERVYETRAWYSPSIEAQI